MSDPIFTQADHDIAEEAHRRAPGLADDPLKPALIAAYLARTGYKKEDPLVVEAREWQPIETAPRDGSPVDLFDHWGRRWTDATWKGGSWSRFSHGRGTVRVYTSRTDDQFTHWMRPPASPLALRRGMELAREQG